MTYKIYIQSSLVKIINANNTGEVLQIISKEIAAGTILYNKEVPLNLRIEPE